MVTALQAITACYDLYDYGTPPPVTKWLYVSASTDPIYYGITQIDDTILVVFRGSTTILDFIRDMEAGANPFNHSKLGPVHPGAWYGLEIILIKIFTQYSPQQVQFTGHSLGAMRATLAAAWTAASFPFLSPALPPRIVFGEPKSGFLQEANLANIPGSLSFWNTTSSILESDPVYNLPFTFYPELYVHGTSPTIVWYAPDGSGPDALWGIVAPHYSGYYLKAVQQWSTLSSLKSFKPTLIQKPPFIILS